MKLQHRKKGNFVFQWISLLQDKYDDDYEIHFIFIQIQSTHSKKRTLIHNSDNPTIQCRNSKICLYSNAKHSFTII